jgi:hypothetical protein
MNRLSNDLSEYTTTSTKLQAFKQIQQALQKLTRESDNGQLTIVVRALNELETNHALTQSRFVISLCGVDDRRQLRVSKESI